MFKPPIVAEVFTLAGLQKAQNSLRSRLSQGFSKYPPHLDPHTVPYQPPSSSLTSPNKGITSTSTSTPSPTTPPTKSFISSHTSPYLIHKSTSFLVTVANGEKLYNLAFILDFTWTTQGMQVSAPMHTPHGRCDIVLGDECSRKKNPSDSTSKNFRLVSPRMANLSSSLTTRRKPPSNSS